MANQLCSTLSQVYVQLKEVLWGEENISALNEENEPIYEMVDWVYRFHLIDHLTVLENVMLPLEITFGRGVKTGGKTVRDRGVDG